MLVFLGVDFKIITFFPFQWTRIDCVLLSHKLRSVGSLQRSCRDTADEAAVHAGSGQQGCMV